MRRHAHRRCIAAAATVAFNPRADELGGLWTFQPPLSDPGATGVAYATRNAP